MDDLKRNILKKLNVLDSKINEKEKLIVMYGLLNREEKARYFFIFTLQSIAKRCVQCGNYMRSCRYIFAVEKLIVEFEKIEKEAKSVITKYMLENN